MRRAILCSISHTHQQPHNPPFWCVLPRVKLSCRNNSWRCEIWFLCVCVWEWWRGCSFYVLCSQLYVLFIQQIIQTPELCSDVWFSKRVVAKSGGSGWCCWHWTSKSWSKRCVVCLLINLRLNWVERDSIDCSHFTLYHTTHAAFQNSVWNTKIFSGLKWCYLYSNTWSIWAWNASWRITFKHDRHTCLERTMVVVCVIGVYCVICDVMWVQGTILEIREQMHWVSVWYTWHNSRTLTCIVSVCILICVAWCVWCVWCHIDDVPEFSERHWSWGSNCTEAVLATLATPHTVVLGWWVCVILGVWCDVMWCDVMLYLMYVRWVQTTTLEMKEQVHWVNVCHTWHNSHSLACVVSVCVTWCDVMWCDVTLMIVPDVQTTTLALKEQRHWVSVCHAWLNSHNLTCIVSMCIDVLLGVYCHIDDVTDACVSTDNNIGEEGANALSHCLSHLPQLTQLDLSCECVHIDVLLGV